MSEKQYRILSIDGGGARGLLAAKFLELLEEKIRLKTNNPNALLADYFDLIVGTSVGALLAGLLTVPKEPGSALHKYDASEACKIFLENQVSIFSVPVLHGLRSLFGLRDEKFHSRGIEKVLFDHIGNTYLSELLLPVVITAYDVRRRRALFFSTFDAQKSPSRDFLVRDVCRGSSAAPTFFEAANVISRTGVEFPCVDGAIFASSPAFSALAEARKLFGVSPDQLLFLSLGVGIDHKVYFHQHIKDFGVLDWVMPLIDCLIGSSMELADYFCRNSFENYGVPEQYLRLNPHLKDLNSELDTNIVEVSPENTVAYLELAQELIETEHKRIDKFLDLVINPGR